MALRSYVALSTGAPAVVVDFVITSNVVVGGAMGVSDATSVEGTVVETVGMTVLEVVAKSLCFD